MHVAIKPSNSSEPGASLKYTACMASRRCSANRPCRWVSWSCGQRSGRQISEFGVASRVTARSVCIRISYFQSETPINGVRKLPSTGLADTGCPCLVVSTSEGQLTMSARQVQRRDGVAPRGRDGDKVFSFVFIDSSRVCSPRMKPRRAADQRAACIYRGVPPNHFPSLRVPKPSAAQGGYFSLFYNPH
jgi:hypothetical protein